MISELYKRDQYLNKNIEIISNKKIIEYDLKSANTSLCREYKLLPEEKIKEIEDMTKSDRVKTIGKLMRKDKKFKDGLLAAFVDIRRRFFEANNIQDEDILSIKKDAIFCFNDQEYTEFGCCKFSDKNIYTSYMYVDRREFYYRRKLDNTFILDVKGIDNKIVKKHDTFMNDFFGKIFYHMETSDKNGQLSFMQRFVDRYKFMELPVG